MTGGCVTFFCCKIKVSLSAYEISLQTRFFETYPFGLSKGGHIGQVSDMLVCFCCCCELTNRELPCEVELQACGLPLRNILWCALGYCQCIQYQSFFFLLLAGLCMWVCVCLRVGYALCFNEMALPVYVMSVSRAKRVGNGWKDYLSFVRSLPAVSHQWYHLASQ